MAKKNITFKLLAYSDAAGKFNPDAPLNGNEDNFYVDDDISDDIPGRCQMDTVLHMSDCGCLMVVADGMGGMNAGEVASDIAISTVKEMFSPGMVSVKIAESSENRRRYLENVIKEADKRIKNDAKTNPEHDGMGSTIIMAWVVGDKVTVSWCGDSRAYRFNPVNGIEPLSRDHSYVQELVNRGDLKYEDTFEHPQGNIVTRSLGDPNNSARPETREFNIYTGDIILLCSDGLSGVLRDKKTKDHNGNYYPGENIEDIIYSNCSSLSKCKDALMSAAERADWYDNVTVLMCQIIDGLPNAVKRLRPNDINQNENQSQYENKRIPLKYSFIASVVCFLLGLGLGWWFTYSHYSNPASKIEGETAQDETQSVPSDPIEGMGYSEEGGSIRGEGTGISGDKPRESVGGKSSGAPGSSEDKKRPIEDWVAKQSQKINDFTCPAELNWVKDRIVQAIQNTQSGQINDFENNKSWVNTLIKDLEHRCELMKQLNQNQSFIPEQHQQEWKNLMKHITTSDTPIKYEEIKARISSWGIQDGELNPVGGTVE